MSIKEWEKTRTAQGEVISIERNKESGEVSQAFVKSKNKTWHLPKTISNLEVLKSIKVGDKVEFWTYEDFSGELIGDHARFVN